MLPEVLDRLVILRIDKKRVRPMRLFPIIIRKVVLAQIFRRGKAHCSVCLNTKLLERSGRPKVTPDT